MSGSYQDGVRDWMSACFGSEISQDKTQRNHRFLEEALELVQSAGCTQSEAHQLVDYVFGRPAGDMRQEVGGVMVTLAGFCLANGLLMHEAGETELARVWTKVEQIRAKHNAKPMHSPLPGFAASPAATGDSPEIACDHEVFVANVDVNRLVDSGRFQADVRIQCKECGKPFRFIGLPAGLDLNGAATNPDATEARLAIAAEGEVVSMLEGAPVGFSIRKD